MVCMQCGKLRFSDDDEGDLCECAGVDSTVNRRARRQVYTDFDWSRTDKLRPTGDAEREKMLAEPRRPRAMKRTNPWRYQPMPSLRDIYDRHRGPYSILTVSEIDRKGKPMQANDHLAGPFSAEEAHEEARVLVNRAQENVVEAFVFSIPEGQFIGAFYKRGETYRPWSQEGMEPPDEISFVEEDVLPKEVAKERWSVSRPPAVKPAVVRTRRALELSHIERWPGSPPAQLVRAFFEEGRRATATEIVQALGPQLRALGVEHPASLVSRLKQGGFLKEVVE